MLGLNLFWWEVVGACVCFCIVMHNIFKPRRDDD